MKISCIFQTARNAVLELENNEIFELEEGWEILVNGAFYGETKRVITSVYGLKPDTDYEDVYKRQAYAQNQILLQRKIPGRNPDAAVCPFFIQENKKVDAGRTVG